MSRHIDIELTSQTGDGSWTWRAAGAKQPKGTVEAALVPPGEAVGAVLRAEVEIGLEGIEILSLAAAKPAHSPRRLRAGLRSRARRSVHPTCRSFWLRAPTSDAATATTTASGANDAVGIAAARAETVAVTSAR